MPIDPVPGPSSTPVAVPAPPIGPPPATASAGRPPVGIELAIPVAPRHPGAPLLLVHVEQHVLVVPEIVTVAYGAPVLLRRELLGGVAAGHLVEFRRRLGQIRGDPEVLDVATHHRSVEVRGDVPPRGRIGMRAAHEHARRRRQRLVAYLLAARLGRAGPDVRAVAVVDEPGLIDTPFGDVTPGPAPLEAGLSSAGLRCTAAPGALVPDT